MTSTTNTPFAGQTRRNSSRNEVTTDRCAGPNRLKCVPTAGFGANPPQSLVDASVLADFLGVSRAFVYEHAAELGAIPLGAGKRPRLRFSLDGALDRLTACSTGRGSTVAVDRMVEPNARTRHRRRAGSGTGSGAQLLEIKRPVVARPSLLDAA